eukprot:CAMPEP_0116087820 /NCGR_PEP_ID=MMETSP0327-20121206/5556_1 /TAXON_ID=44447 /ORGANISM="Pseudo-nitzschia delicatissima, Strain B596" /LENGTH=168 /DNA_ID=CAMNT_0003578891 /DNA_START=17 /DNA_END=521 /DNA_ORIENTATION=-
MINTTQLQEIKIGSTMSIDNDCDRSRTSTASMSSCEDDSLDEFSVMLSPTIDNGQVNKKKKRVRFGTLEVHEHAVELGGAGVPASGPPMTLEWEQQAYYWSGPLSFSKTDRPFENRRGSELLQSTSQRINMLLDAGHSLSEINNYMKENEIVRRQRCETIKKAQRFPV